MWRSIDVVEVEGACASGGDQLFADQGAKL
jgi:hypothetical protein